MIIGKTRTNQPVEDEGKVAGLVEDMIGSGDLVINGAWEEDIDLTIANNWLNGLEVVNGYSKALIKNGVMYIVLSLQLKNNTENAITTSNVTPVFTLTINDNVASKIYRKDGTNLLVNSESASNILTKQGYYSTSSGGAISGFASALNSDAKNIFYLYPRSSISIPSGEIRLFDFRTFITL